MKTMMKGLLIVLVVAALPLGASAQQLFDFNGQALLPAGVGGQLTMYSVMFDPAPIDSPIPLDFANYEFTLVLEGATLTVDGISRIFAGGTVTIYQDAATSADYANPATFTDGTAILVGNLTSLSQFVPPVGPGSASGHLDWVGGTRLTDMAPDDQLNWTFVSGTNANSGMLEPGYDEVWDGKTEPPSTIVDTEAASMSKVKALFK